MNKRLEKTKSWGGVPFDIDFLREIGIAIGLDWDDELIIKYPDDIPDRMKKLISEFREGIKKRLGFERKRRQHCFVGGPLNGKGYDWIEPNKPFCYHVKRSEWAVYIVKSWEDPRAWFVGTATSKKKAKSLKLIKRDAGE